ncbi:MAG: prepilin-type N-terminal cleavage/methylation domain-containing protein [Clostridia bacterium]|nr:prepilin-type N-terminal cleavage/methylation domain-containing protein [Clostridia bacterium]
MLNYSSKRGLTLIELIIVIAIIAIVVPSAYSLFMRGSEAYSTSNNQLVQQGRVIDVVQFIRKDVEEAQRIQMPDPNLNEVVFTFGNPGAGFTYRHWAFYNDGTLRYWDSNGNSETVEDELDCISNAASPGTISNPNSPNCNSKFNITGDKFIMSIKPRNTNIGKYQSANINNPIITEFSVRYKR